MIRAERIAFLEPQRSKLFIHSNSVPTYFGTRMDLIWGRLSWDTPQNHNVWPDYHSARVEPDTL